MASSHDYVADSGGHGRGLEPTTCGGRVERGRAWSHWRRLSRSEPQAPQKDDRRAQVNAPRQDCLWRRPPHPTGFEQHETCDMFRMSLQRPGCPIVKSRGGTSADDRAAAAAAATTTIIQRDKLAGGGKCTEDEQGLHERQVFGDDRHYLRVRLQVV